MFWGLIMEPQRRYTQTVKKAFHISMASLDVATSSDEVSQLMCCYEGKNYLLCSLKKPNMLQCPLDLNFEAGTVVSFAANGKCHIHLTGYLTDDMPDLDDEEQEEEEEDDEVEALEEEDEELDEEEQDLNLKNNKRKNKGEDPAGKKAKAEKVSSSQDVEDDEDEDEEIGSDSDTDQLEEEEDENEEEDSDDDDDDEEEEEEKPQPIMNGDAKKKEKDSFKQKQQQQQQAQKKKVLQGGVVVEEIKEGQGKPAKNGRFVTVHYEGRLKSNNKMFDSNTKGSGFSFRLGSGEVIKGWDVGVAGMKIGSKRRITCPPHMAYGARGSHPAIPPNATLVFEVELKKIS